MGNREHRRANKHARDQKARALCHEYYSKYCGFDGPEACYVELEEPIFWGYRRFFVLREAYALTNNAQKWRTILEAIQNVEESKRKDFRVRLRRARRWIEREHRLQPLGACEFYRLIPSRWHHHFEEYVRKGTRRYRFLHREMFESRREKVFITHHKILDRAWERQAGYLSGHLENHGYERIYWKMRRGDLWDSDYRRYLYASMAHKRKRLDLNEMRADLLDFQLGEAFSLIDHRKQTDHG